VTGEVVGNTSLTAASGGEAGLSKIGERTVGRMFVACGNREDVMDCGEEVMLVIHEPVRGDADDGLVDR